MDQKLPKNLVMAFYEKDMSISDIIWSGRFKIDTVGEFLVKLYNEKRKDELNNLIPYFLRVKIVNFKGSFVVNLLPEDKANPQYLLRNDTQYDLTF
jgi:hypothetical protein